jgi:hypothetical protein
MLSCLSFAVACGGNSTPADDTGGHDIAEDTSPDIADGHVDTEPADLPLRDGDALDDTANPDDPGPADAAHDANQDSVEPADTINPDDTTDTTEPVPVAQPSPHGRILIALSKSGSFDYNTEAWSNIEFYDSPMRMDAFAAYTPGMYEVFRQEGDCVMYVPTSAACNPVCNYDEYCDQSDQCVKAPSRISAGKLTLTFGATKIEVEPTGDGLDAYWYYVEGVAASLIHSGNTIISEADGQVGGFEAFEVTTTGVDATAFSSDSDSGLALEDGRDNVVTWAVPDKNTAGLYVDLVLNTGWHGSPPASVLYCRKEATAGSLTIPQAMVEALPVIGCMGLFQHGSHIGMSRTASADVAGKTVDLTVTRRHGFYPTHNNDDCM